MHNPKATSAILKFWRSIEIFSPQSIPKPAPNDRNDPVFSMDPELPLPWESRHSFKSRQRPQNLNPRFLVFNGVLGLPHVRAVLEEKLGSDPESFDERIDGDTCIFAFTTDEDGRPLFDTFVLSSCAWATSRTLTHGPQDGAWLEGFEEASSAFSLDFAERYAVEAHDAKGMAIAESGVSIGRPLLHRDLQSELDRISKNLGLDALERQFAIRIQCSVTSASLKNASNDISVLNSFFLNDLSRVSKEIEKNNFGTALADFLSHEPDTTSRVDIRNSTDAQFRQLSPSRFPRGRWPSAGHHPLVFSQQFAINTMKEDLRNRPGLFAVNGPPGTGKTTMLRDLIASIVVDRAERLAELPNPQAAFSGQGKWKTGDYERVVALWKDELKGFEIVISSNNNGAVENVSNEIPGINAVDESWLGETDYFSEIGSRLLGNPAWAMMASRLGNKSNRNEFASKFWYGDKVPDPDGEDSGEGFQGYLKRMGAERFEWKTGVENFKAVLQKEQALRTQRETAYKDYIDSSSLRRRLGEHLRDIREHGQLYELEIVKLEEAKKEGGKLKSHVVAREQIRSKHLEYRPGVMEIIFSFGGAIREWREKDKVLESKFDEAQVLFDKTRARVDAIGENVSRLAVITSKLQAVLENLHHQRDINAASIDRDKKRLGAAYPDVGEWISNEGGRELSSPWADAEWNKARAEVFIAALELHKWFIMANANIMRRNLQAAMDVLSGTVPANAPQSAVESAWATLFFVVPVASSTFASFDRLFKNLGREAIGWLLIDEAGQAAPQAAAGAIWRSRRTVIVGDPLQLEPVVTLPFTAQQSLRQHYGVAETWLPSRASVQQLADRVSRYGTTVNTGDVPLWVGSPLRVHRRCDQPMFDISNVVAYDGLMVFGTGKRGGQSSQLPVSQWVDVQSTSSDGHWIAEEGLAAERWISELSSSGVAHEEIFLISPFRAVVKELRHIAYKYPGVKSGTVHTVQGKESDVVILVLGGNPTRPGAKQWASLKPNLLNVAVSRAKRRLYVVGDKASWQKYPFFTEAVALLA